MTGKITAVKVEHFYGEDQYTATYEDGTEEFLFGALPSELRFTAEDLIGKTSDEASAMFCESMALANGC